MIGRLLCLLGFHKLKLITRVGNLREYGKYHSYAVETRKCQRCKKLLIEEVDEKPG